MYRRNGGRFKMEITHTRLYEQLKIYIDGKIHLHLKLLDLVGFQSWIHGSNEYFIEYYFSTRDKITTVYGTKEKWFAILDILDKAITVVN
jgi:hypothetical protein